MAELQRPGVSVHYETLGASGGWVTLINGHNRPLNDFRMLARYLVEHGRRVLMLDNRGSGQTGSTGDFTLADMAADVAAIWQQEHIDRTALLGISMGGFVAQLLAAQAAESPAAVQIDRLILVSTAMRESLIHRGDASWSSDPAAVEATLLPYFTPSFAERNAPLIKGMAKQIAKAVASGDFLQQSQRQLRAVRGFDLSAQARGITAATLVVHGSDDQIIPLEGGGELAAAIPGARLLELPGSGHLLLAEKPRELYEAVGSFFG